MKSHAAHLIVLVLATLVGLVGLGAPSPAGSAPEYLYLWTGSADSTEPDFLAVLDVSSAPGRLVTTLPVPGRRNGPHHTEYDPSRARMSSRAARAARGEGPAR